MISNVKYRKGSKKREKLQIVHNAYKIRTALTKLAENNFYFDLNKINDVVEQNTKNITDEKLTIFLVYQSEFEERRLELDRAMGCCNVL